ncbi:uncharacterized protein LOC144915477 [Branchiostoma floridae x Branchiostoma belcheri]
MAPRKEDKVNQEDVSYKTEQSAKPDRLCRLRLPLIAGVLVGFLTAGLARGQSVGEFRDTDQGLVAVRAPGSKTCYIVDAGYTDRDNEEEADDSGKYAISLDESRTDQPKLSGDPELKKFCDGLTPQWATAEPAAGASHADVIVYTGTPDEEQEKPGRGQTKFFGRRRSSWWRRRTVYLRRRSVWRRRTIFRRRSWLGK